MPFEVLTAWCPILRVKIDDRVDVFLPFRGESHHEVEPQVHDAVFDEMLHGPEDLILRDPFADHVPKSLGARLGGKGYHLHAGVGQKPGEVFRDPVDPERPDGEGALLAEDLPADLCKLRVVGDGRPEQPHPPFPPKPFLQGGCERREFAETGRPVDESGRTEPAPTVAAPAHLGEKHVAELGVRGGDHLVGPEGAQVLDVAHPDRSRKGRIDGPKGVDALPGPVSHTVEFRGVGPLDVALQPGEDLVA